MLTESDFRDIDTPPGWEVILQENHSPKFRYNNYYTPLPVRPQAWSPSGRIKDTALPSPNTNVFVVPSYKGDGFQNPLNGRDEPDILTTKAELQRVVDEELPGRSGYRHAIAGALTTAEGKPRSLIDSLSATYDYWDLVGEIADDPGGVEGVGPTYAARLLSYQSFAFPSWLDEVCLLCCPECDTGWWQFVFPEMNARNIQSHELVHCPQCMTEYIPRSCASNTGVPLEAFEYESSITTARSVAPHSLSNSF